MQRRKNSQYGNHRNISKPQSPPSTGFSVNSNLPDSSVKRSHASSDTDRVQKDNSRNISRSAQKKIDCLSPSEDLTGDGSQVPDMISISSGIEGLSLTDNSPNQISGKTESISSVLKKPLSLASTNITETCHREGHQDEENSQKKSGLVRESDISRKYDICPPRQLSCVELKPSLLVRNKESRNEKKRNMEGNIISVLRPGMIHLKKYLSVNDQVNLVRKCRDLGLGPEGFYQPEYHDGATLNLKMMCLGKKWNPEKGYDNIRSTDGTKPPLIPYEFSQLVERVLKDSHAHLKEKHHKRNVEDILPSMSPNICIVNFYTTSGRLGLHQDKDESPQSLVKGLPVVSFSVGESAEFLYGDQRDELLADKVLLESGDVLIFGGKARHIYHGVSAIKPNTAPTSLKEATGLKPGRLNLTFREY